MYNLKTFSYGVVPNIIGLVVSGSASGNYVGNYDVFTTNDGQTLTKIAYGTVTSANSIDSNILLNLYGNTSFTADITISGTPLTPISIMVKS